MNLTHKAIARMAGYRVEMRNTAYPNMNLAWGDWYYWKNMDEDGNTGKGRYVTEDEAWQACCIENELVEVV